jgi:hypothetical protein
VDAARAAAAVSVAAAAVSVAVARAAVAAVDSSPVDSRSHHLNRPEEAA